MKHFDRVLITGGAGFIGSNLADTLLSAGKMVAVLDNFDSFYQQSIKESNIKEALLNPNYLFVEGDIRDSETVDSILREHQPEVVIHLAAKAGVRPSIENPKEYYDVNVMGTLNILERMRENSVKRLVFASSSSVYGNNEKKPFAETDRVDNPISPYAATKKSGELMCHMYHYLHGLEVTCLRFFTVYGPRQRPDLAIHKFTQRIMNEEPIPVFGDGTSSRDYTYIQDIVEGITSAAQRLNGFEVINLGESKTISLSELISTIESEIGQKAIIDRLGKQPGDVDSTFADIAKAKQLLGYAPEYTKEMGIKAFVDWKRKTMSQES